MNILIFGASITWGAVDVEKGGWVERLKAHYFTSFSISRDHIYNAGVSGQTTTDVLRRFQSEARERAHIDPSKNIILFSVGANDCAFVTERNTFNTPPEQYQGNMEQLITQAKSLAHIVGVTTITPVNEASSTLDRNGKVRKNEYVDKYNSLLKQSTEELNVDFIDISGRLKENPSGLLSEDGLHPNSAGHQIIFEEVLQYLKRKMDVETPLD